MRIIQINETCGIGSTGRTTLELAQALDSSGHFSHVFYASGQSSYAKSTRVGCDLDHKLHAFLSRLFGTQGYFSRLATRRMLKQLDALQPDVVHLRNLHGNYINLGMLLRHLAKKDIATVLTLHDCWFMTGKCTYYLSANCQKWKTCCGECPLLRVDNVNPTWFFDRTRKCFQDKKRWFQAIPRLAVAGVSQWVSDEANQSIFQSRNPIAIYNWIDADVFYPQNAEAVRSKYQLGQSFVILMVTGQLSAIKGYHVLEGLANALDSAYRLVVVGKNDLRLPIPANVLHISHTNDARELAALYSAADVCVNTTQFETFGKVTAEALCCGTPVIVYNNTASPELVGSNCGYVVEEADGLDAIIGAIRQIRHNGKSAYTQDCVTFATSRFSKQEGVAQYLALYESLLQQR